MASYISVQYISVQLQPHLLYMYLLTDAIQSLNMTFKCTLCIICIFTEWGWRVAIGNWTLHWLSRPTCYVCLYQRRLAAEELLQLT